MREAQRETNFQCNFSQKDLRLFTFIKHLLLWAFFYAWHRMFAFFVHFVSHVWRRTCIDYCIIIARSKRSCQMAGQMYAHSVVGERHLASIINQLWPHSHFAKSDISSIHALMAGFERLNEIKGKRSTTLNRSLVLLMWKWLPSVYIWNASTCFVHIIIGLVLKTSHKNIKTFS